MAEPARKSPQEEVQPDIRPNLRAMEGGGESTDRKSGHLSSAPNPEGGNKGGFYNPDDSKASGRPNLRVLEGGKSSEGGKKTSTAASPSELNDAENDDGLYNDTGQRPKRRFGRFYKRNSKKLKIGAGIGGVGVGGIFLFMSVTQGPFQFIHFAQLLQQFHMSSNEDFSDSRTEKILIYSLAGKGGERGRLSVKANFAADAWQKQVEKTMGIRPIYTSITRKNVGWEIVDKDKFMRQMLNISVSDTKNTAAIEKIAGRGAEIRTVGELTANGQDLSPGRDGPNLSNDDLVLYTGKQDSKSARIFTRVVSQETHTSRVISAIGARLLIKRGGVTYHPLEDKLPQPGEKLADFYSRIRKQASAEDRNGVKDTTLAQNNEKDAEGKSEATPGVDAATDETNAAVDAAKESPGTDTLKGLVKGLGKGAAAVGVLCAVKGVGNNITDYKQTNDALPMMRMGTRVMATGNQVMSGDGFNMKVLGAFNDSLYDPETKTSWTSARSIQAELGQKQTGPDMPPEASLRNVNDKPVFFDVIDGVPGLGPVCGVASAAGNLPIIKQVSEASTSVIFGGLNLIATQFDTSVDAIMQGALAILSGQSVNTEARGAELGNLANTGSFLSANNTAMANGGVPLDEGETVALKQEASQDIRIDNSRKSFAGRYLNPYDRTTLVAAAIDKMPATKSQVASMFSSPVRSLFGNFSSVISNFTPSAYAAGTYNYGVPKVGFSIAERDNPEFSDPFENAAIVEKPGVLDSLNERYGKPCFGMTVTAGPDGTSVHSEGMDSDGVNSFKVLDNPDCSPPKTASSASSSPLMAWLFPKVSAATQGNTDPMFLRYRFYLADAVNTDGLACFYGDDETCSSLGFGDSASSNGVNAAPAADTGTTTLEKLPNPLPGGHGQIDPKGITLHWWGSKSGGRGINYLVDALRGNQACPGGCSVQVGITNDGKAYQMTKNLTDLTYHAIGGNETTFGIEIEGGPADFGADGPKKNPAKFNAVVNTVKYLVKRYDIPLDGKVVCGNVSGVHPHKAYNSCPGAIQKDDIDDAYFKQVMQSVRGQ